jgi:hypothetical protein
MFDETALRSMQECCENGLAVFHERRVWEHQACVALEEKFAQIVQVRSPAPTAKPVCVCLWFEDLRWVCRREGKGQSERKGGGGVMHSASCQIVQGPA